MPQNEYNGVLYFLPIQYSHNSSLKIAYSEEYDNHFNVLVLGYLLTDEQNCFEFNF